jgi:hypothetical protein
VNWSAGSRHRFSPVLRRSMDALEAVLIASVPGVSEHLDQHGKAVDGVADTALGHQPALGVDQGDVVVGSA